MKKNALIVSLVLTLGMFLTSCSEKKACYQISGEKWGLTWFDEYYWGTAQEAELRLTELKEANSESEGLETKVTPVDKAEADCTGEIIYE
jgi:hypothetical protein